VRNTVKLIALVAVLLVVLGSAALAYNEASALKEMVENGELPPVEERLPNEPVVVEPYEGIGKYGGTAYVLSAGGPGDAQHINVCQPILVKDPYTGEIEPNIAVGWEFNDDATELTLHLREGLRWSDGTEFTSEDISFLWNDYYFNETLTPSPSASFPQAVVSVDKYTVKYVFDKPNFWYLEALCGPSHIGGAGYMPTEYMKQFHIEYNEDADKLAEDAGFETWDQMFQLERWYCFWYPGVDKHIPTLRAFHWVESGPGVWHEVRNPYFWKVDTAGNQLPYIDDIQIAEVSDDEARNLKALQGQATLYFYTPTLEDYPMFKREEAEGKIKVLLWNHHIASDVVLLLNQTVTDPMKRELFQCRSFREALSIGIDRDDINDVLYLDMGEPRQATVLANSRFYKEEYANAYIDYNPEKANWILDNLGLITRDGDGYRVAADGNRVKITCVYSTALVPAAQRTLEIVRDNWRDIGVELNLRAVERNLQNQMIENNEVDMTMWAMDETQDSHLASFNGSWFYPSTAGAKGAFWAPAWGLWNETKGEGTDEETASIAEEPPLVIKEIGALIEDLKTAATEAETEQAGSRIIDIHAQNLWMIGLVGNPPKLVVIDENLGNFPETGITSWDYMWLSTYNGETLYFK